GYVFYPVLRNPGNALLKSGVPVALAAGILAGVFLVCRTINNDIGIYQEKLNVFTEKEKQALKLYTLPENTTKEATLTYIKDSGIVNWKANLQLMDEIATLQLPADVVARNARLKEYCRLRLLCYNLMYKAVEENTEKYKDSINSYDNLIQAIIKEIGGE
ncbi:MAG: hypothetical protein ACXVPQ_10910, partial [Bacteroidia bacterium]